MLKWINKNNFNILRIRTFDVFVEELNKSVNE